MEFKILNFKLKIKAGFTLLEMLVVIGIIAVLVGIGSVSYSTSQKKSRDAKRKSDLKVIQNSMEQYYSVCGYKYPTSIGSGIVCSSPTMAILPTIPVDPKTLTPYPCSPCTETSYSVCSNNLESESPTGYCVSNQQ
ncbi:type II secretion system protein [Candidatus Roizmanbacteria bacterium]|jgi:prepilin-type N-terminal cleavage/methylation domain-containing protein|nr:type II secretion system protein [Candidatus Roizmanbacteria bacterium]